jgi:hypothetical protein
VNTIPDEVLDRPVNGINLIPGPLRDQLVEGPTLLVFLRHFGCIFCRETLADLRAIFEADPDFPRVLFFFQGTPTEGRAFLRRYWPDVRAVSDPELDFYDAFGVRRANIIQALGPSVLLAGRRARAKGHEGGALSGDIWRMPGVIAVDGDRVLWRYQPRHAADHPDFASIPQEIQVIGA